MKIKKLLKNTYYILIKKLGKESLARYGWQEKLKELADSVNEYIQTEKIQKKCKILVPTTFNASKNWWIHDGIITAALRIRGAEVIPVICDGIQSDECVSSAGKWQESKVENSKKQRKKTCSDCIKRAEKMWGIWGLTPIKLSSFISSAEISEFRKKAASWVDSDWENIKVKGFNVGYEAWKATVNNDLKAIIDKEFRERANSLAYHHILNILILTRAYELIISNYTPDRIFGNGGFYYQWGVPYHISQKCNIPYYRYHQIGLHKDAWNYARNSLELIDLDSAWHSWLKQPWTLQKEQCVDNELLLRGVTVISDNKKKEEVKKGIVNKLNLDANKPIVLALTGVAWDATTNAPSATFKNMYEWLWDTIDWFAEHPKSQLIIRVHPGENVVENVNPKNRTSFSREAEKKGVKIPGNVRIIQYYEKISTYDLMSISKIGMTYLSTTALEMSCLGLPVIVVGNAHYSGKGFTFDPKTKEEYYKMLSDLVSNDLGCEKKRQVAELAKKYWYLYSFCFSIKIELIEKLKENYYSSKELSWESLLPGTDAYLDYLCDSIINDLPIAGENRWPPDLNELDKDLCVAKRIPIVYHNTNVHSSNTE